MSAFAKRSYVPAEWKRPTVVPGVEVTEEDMGTLQVHAPIQSTVAQNEDFITAPTGRFEIYFDPSEDLQVGDLLTFNGYVHEVVEVRNQTGGKRHDHAEADVYRKEIGTT